MRDSFNSEVPRDARGPSHVASTGELRFNQPVDARGRFLNLDGSTPHGFFTVFKWGVVDRLLGRRRRSPDTAQVARVEPDLARLQSPPASAEGAHLTWLGHSSWLVQLDGLSLLIDPVLENGIFGIPRRNVAPAVLIERLPRIDAQLVSHDHYDHLDLPTLVRVGAPVLAGLGLGSLFTKSSLCCTELGWWQSTKIGPVTITFVPAAHWSRRGLFDGNRTLWGGFVIQGSSATIYHAGDSAYFEGFAEIGRRFEVIDAALLPIGAYDPGWFMEKQHLTPEQALRAFADLGARTFLAMHWGTFKLADEPLDEPAQRLELERLRLGLPRDRVRIPAVGEMAVVPSGP